MRNLVKAVAANQEGQFFVEPIDKGDKIFNICKSCSSDLGGQRFNKITLCLNISFYLNQTKLRKTLVTRIAYGKIQTKSIQKLILTAKRNVDRFSISPIILLLASAVLDVVEPREVGSFFASRFISVW